MRLENLLEYSKPKYRSVSLHPDSLRVKRESIIGTMDDLLAGKISYTQAPLDTLQAGSGQYVLIDGYHRFLEAYILGVKKLRVKNDDSLALSYGVFDRSEAWDYDLSKLISSEKLDELKNELSQKSSMIKFLD